MAQVHLDWIIKGRIVGGYLSGKWEMATFERYNARLLELFADGQAPLVHLIVNGLDLEGLPVNIFKIRKVVTYLDHPLMGWNIAVAHLPVIDMIANIITQIGQVRYRTVSTNEKAITFLRSQDQSLAWDEADLTKLQPPSTGVL